MVLAIKQPDLSVNKSTADMENKVLAKKKKIFMASCIENKSKPSDHRKTTEQKILLKCFIIYIIIVIIIIIIIIIIIYIIVISIIIIIIVFFLGLLVSYEKKAQVTMANLGSSRQY